MAIKILKGESNIEEMPIEYVEKTECAKKYNKDKCEQPVST